MKYVFLFIIIIISIFGCQIQCEKGNGIFISKKTELKPFNSIDASGQCQIYITQGNQHFVEVKGDSNLVELVSIVQNRKTIDIELKNCIYDKSSLNIYVTTPEFSDIELSGMVFLQSENTINSKKLNIETSGASEINLDLQVQKLKINASGACNMRLQGIADKFNASFSGASKLKALDLQTRIATIEGSGASNLHINTIEVLKVDLSGSGVLEYKGNPKISSDISGAATIKKFE